MRIISTFSMHYNRDALTYFESSKRGFCQSNKKNIILPRIPNLIENIRCHKTDEYPVINTEDETPVPPLACNFSRVKNNGHILALVDENGSIILYDTNKAGEDSLITDWSAHNNAIFDVKWMGHENKVLTASGDQTVCLWDVKSQSKIYTFKGHTSSVRSVAFRPFDDAVFSSGSRDGHIRLWDIRCNIKESVASSVHVIRNAHTVTQNNTVRKKKSRLGQNTQDSQQSVTCVLFQDDNLLATGGAVDGCVKVWDMRKIKTENNLPVYSFPYSGPSRRTHGYSSLVFDSYFSRLYANCTDDVVYCYDFTTYNPNPVSTFKGHRNTSFYVKSCVSPDNQYLLSGSSDEHACIWQVNNPSASPVILKGHRSEISDVAWCHMDLYRIVTTSDDYTMRVWRYDPTAKIRKEKGHTDQMYNITGSAECTHRDIGISTPQTPTVSPKSSLKRAASVPPSLALELTPKRPKVPVAGTPSPSIKAWLKRSASDTQASTSCDSACKKSKTTEDILVTRNSVKRPASEMESENSNTVELVEKRQRIGDDDHFKDSVGASKIGSEPVCKRALIQTSCDSDEGKEKESVKLFKNPYKENEKSSNRQNEKSPNKENEKSPNKNIQMCHKRENEKSPSKENEKCSKNENEIGRKNGFSPNKRVLKDSDTNSSPNKIKDCGLDFYSPVRPRMFDKNLEQNIQSPTANLPNLVVDGPICSPKLIKSDNSSKRKVDWLTEMRIQKLSVANKHSSPNNKQCSRRLLDKLINSEKTEILQEKNNKDQETTGKSKPISPVRGSKSITSFFRRQQNV